MERSESSKIAGERQPELQKTLSILHKWGIHTLGQLAALDKEELRSRLGSEAVRLWERANGTATRLLKFVQPPENFEESFEFDHEIETAEPLLFMLRRFLEQLALRLSGIYLVAHELTLRITFSGPHQVRHGETNNGNAARTYERVFKIPQPTNDIDLLFRMLQTHLENFKSEHPIIAVALNAKPTRSVSQQFGLFETALRNPQQLFETLARLTALLGSDRIGTPVLEETHRPDAFRMEPFAWRQNDQCRMTNEQGNLKDERADARALLPLSHRERRTQSASEGSGVWRDGGVRASPRKLLRIGFRRFRPPANTTVFISDQRYLVSDKIRGEIIDQRGPYLLSGNWWDEKAWARAEWDMQLNTGELVRAHQSPPSKNASLARTGVRRRARGAWKLDGIYD